jgi:SAM-dependent methyltransferase
MSGLGRLLHAAKRELGIPYRRAQRTIGHAVFERGLQSTERPDVSSGHLFLRRALRGDTVRPGDVFLDYGSGNGRVLLHAARLPFARVIGLDLDEHAMAIARANAEAVAGRRGFAPIEVLNADATVWQIPDEVMYIYMFNPFWDEVFRGMLDRLLESLDRRPRPLTLLYAYPTCADQVLATGRFELVRASRGFRPDMPQHRIEVFRAIVPPTA